MAIETSQLTVAQLEVLVVPPGESYAITNILVCNNSTSIEAFFDMYIVKSGDVVNSAVNRVVHSMCVPETDTFTFDTERIVLREGDKLVFTATTTDLSALVSYLEV